MECWLDWINVSNWLRCCHSGQMDQQYVGSSGIDLITWPLLYHFRIWTTSTATLSHHRLTHLTSLIILVAMPSLRRRLPNSLHVTSSQAPGTFTQRARPNGNVSLPRVILRHSPESTNQRGEKVLGRMTVMWSMWYQWCRTGCLKFRTLNRLRQPRKVQRWFSGEIMSSSG